MVREAITATQASGRYVNNAAGVEEGPIAVKGGANVTDLEFGAPSGGLTCTACTNTNVSRNVLAGRPPRASLWCWLPMRDRGRALCLCATRRFHVISVVEGEHSNIGAAKEPQYAPGWSSDPAQIHPPLPSDAFEAGKFYSLPNDDGCIAYNQPFVALLQPVLSHDRRPHPGLVVLNTLCDCHHPCPGLVVLNTKDAFGKAYATLAFNEAFKDGRLPLPKLPVSRQRIDSVPPTPGETRRRGSRVK
jgi:hypothetical protein